VNKEREKNQNKSYYNGLEEEQRDQVLSLKKWKPFLAQCSVGGLEFIQLKKIGEKRPVIRYRLHLEEVIFV